MDTQSLAAQRIVPNIWCSGTAGDAGSFYSQALPNTSFEIESRYPTTGLLPFQEPLAGEPLTVAVSVGGYRLTLVNAGDEFRPNQSISLMLNFDPLNYSGGVLAARAELDATWEALADGGEVLMPLGEYPFSARYGWVADRYGVNWQLMLTDPAGDPRPFVIPSLLFGAGVQNRAAEAIDFYVSVFSNAAAGMRAPYGESTGPASADALMFGEFRIGEQWFAAMDSGVEQQESFSCGVSLEVKCEDQEEIDRLWEALSAVPEAEQCGWLADKFGVSWQIVPENMGELMERPDAFPHMLQMKKLIIAEI
ncbi:VOC family protein [Leucobacter luti]|uniref:VOC family protein n=1 Tax=Leucobacter luti TaxID=340320 RepID=UPI001C68DEB7|nr:VOC family protein [Leucobacter luti]QYM76558.1 VOC family protein [Leucobacter luti]